MPWPARPPLPSVASLSVVVASLLAIPLSCLGAIAQAPSFPFAREGVLGTSSQLTVRAADAAAAERAAAAVFAEVERLATVLSTWDEHSELSRLCTAGGGRPSAELAEVLASAAQWRERSHGAFEPGIARLGRLWQQAAKDGVVPTPAALAAEVAALRDPSYTLRDGALQVRGPLTLDAFAKGHIVDRAVRALAKEPGVALVAFQIGGDTRLGAEPTTIALADPRQHASNAPPLATLRLADRAVASSGGYARGFDVAGVHHSHILDPRTGQPCDGVLGASVVAADTATADALATLLCVLGPKEGLALLADVPGAEGVLVTADGKEHRSPGFAALLDGTAAPAAAATPAAAPIDPKAWPPGFALQVDFEIKAPASSGTRGRGGWKRPYVAVWIEDITGSPVRTLALWYDNDRWLRDLRRWTRSNAETPRLASLVSQATRKAGAYQLAWDGTDDEGRQVIANRYLVCIEVVREHGSYQLIRQELAMLQQPSEKQLEGNEEVAAAKLTFGPVPRSTAK
jgi:thiamine biosynthesis lipoprotein